MITRETYTYQAFDYYYKVSFIETYFVVSTVNGMPPNQLPAPPYRTVWVLVDSSITVSRRQPISIGPDGERRGYKYLRDTGQLIPALAYNIQKMKTLSKGSYDAVNWTTGATHISNAARLNSSANQSDIYIADRVAANNFHASLRSRQNISAGVLIGEIGESLSLVTRTATTMYQIFVALKRGRISDAIEAIQNHYGSRGQHNLRGVRMRNRTSRSNLSRSEYASLAWLELQFGWKPILQDLYDLIVIIFDSLSLVNKRWLSISGYGKGPPFIEYNDYTDTNGFTTKTTYSERQIGVTSIYSIGSDAVDVLSSYGLVNPASIAWELIPFSFVIDWFIPIGHIIESTTAEAGLVRESVSASCKRSFTRRAINDSYWFENNLVSETVHESFTRTIVSDSDFPDVPFQLTSLLELTDSWHVITSMALLRSVFGR